jgi:hypothetical protein
MTLAMLLASPAALGQVDPLRTPACLAAVDALGKAEDAAVAAKAAGSPPGGPGSALAAARRGVGATCLGSTDLTPPTARVRQPVSVEGTTPLPAGVLNPPRSPHASVPVSQARPLVTISDCDSTGCWASDGTRLLRQGQVLLGPRGYCVLTGAFVACP